MTQAIRNHSGYCCDCDIDASFLWLLPPAIINLIATKKNGSWNNTSQKIKHENQAISTDGAFFINASPKRSLYHATTSVNAFG
mmetsp:Transcript_7233/g.16999  ORF Transcript_7233/g.16999 Transcript_7233/m.16999 type:complete len:83 (+) Transcript_7233:1707-1955(+)